MTLVERVKQKAKERNVFPKFISLLSDGSFWLPNCMGDVQNGGVRLFPNGRTAYYCNYYDYEKDEVLTPIEQFELEGVTHVGYPFRLVDLVEPLKDLDEKEMRIRLYKSLINAGVLSDYLVAMADVILELAEIRRQNCRLRRKNCRLRGYEGTEERE